MALRNRDLYDYLKTNNFGIAKSTFVKTKLLNFVTSKCINLKLTIEQRDALQQQVNIYSVHLDERWKKSSRNVANFLRRNANWLDMEFKMPHSGTSHSGRGGRQKLQFQDTSARTKRSRLAATSHIVTTPEAIGVTQRKLQI